VEGLVSMVSGEDAITVQRIDELLRFLPRFEVPGRAWIEGVGGGEETAEGAVTMRYPIYCEDVLAFYRSAGQPWWSDYGYKPHAAAQMLADGEGIAQATMDEIKTMLTYCVRGERFADGHWAAMLESGRVAAILRRLAVLREGL
jgi:hypothetical protein